MKRAVIVFLGLLLGPLFLTPLIPVHFASAAVIDCECYDSDPKLAQSFNEEAVDCPTLCSKHHMQEAVDLSCLCKGPDGITVNVDGSGADCSAVCEAVGDTYEEPAGAPASPLQSPTIPILSVPFDPDFHFTAPVEKNGTISSNFIGQYVNGAYKYLLGFCVILAIVMVMIGGLQYVLAGASGDVAKAKTRIGNAVVGLVLLLFIVTILAVVNPQTTFFGPLNLTTISKDAWELEEEDDSVTGGSVVTDFVSINEPNVGGTGVDQVPSDLADGVTQAAKAMGKSNMGILITSSFRTKQQQIDIIKEHCQNAPGASSCNHKAGKSTACIMPGLDPATCPHTTGRALDIWATKDGEQCIRQDACLKDLPGCFNNPCQAALIKEMKAQGFCVLSIEPWHFENPKMSSKCN